MRRIVTVLLVASIAAVLAASPAGARPEAADQAAEARGELTAQTHADPAAPERVNFGQVIYNHFGRASAGQAVIQGWIHESLDPESLLPSANQARCQGIRLYRAVRIALQCRMLTAGGTRDDLAIGPTTNSGDIGNPRIFQTFSPSISAGFGDADVPQFCLSWWEARYSIRWDDGTLTSGRVVVAPADHWNDNCYFLSAAARTQARG
jgi:hypothetical protein